MIKVISNAKELSLHCTTEYMGSAGGQLFKLTSMKTCDLLLQTGHWTVWPNPIMLN